MAIFRVVDKYGMRRFMNIVENAETGPVKLYHLTNNPHFELDPEFEPMDNALSINPRDGHKGIYVCRDVEPWINGHGYIRPFVAEILADPEALKHDPIGRWSGEIFIPASQFDKLTVTRVVPLDALCREQYSEHGWLEASLGRTFDTGEEITSWKWDEPYHPPFREYRYEHDVRHMSPDQIAHLQRHYEAGHEARLNYR